MYARGHEGSRGCRIHRSIQAPGTRWREHVADGLVRSSSSTEAFGVLHLQPTEVVLRVCREVYHWRTNASDAVTPGKTGAIIEAWSKYKAADVVKLGYRAVEADGGKFYLNHLHPIDSQWTDIGANIETPAEHELMLDGEIAMWTRSIATALAMQQTSTAAE